MISVEPLVQAGQKEVLESYRREFDLLSAGFRDLDSKAQGTATTAGAFLAVGLALLNRPGSFNDVFSKAILILAVLGLLGAILSSVQALRIRKVLSCPSGAEVAGLLMAIKDRPSEELVQRLLYFYGDVADLWRSCVKDRRTANEQKGRLVWLAQLNLAGTALAIGLYLVKLLVTE